MTDLTVWALAKAREIVDCEGSALVTCVQKLKIYEIEAETTLLAVAISEALLEAFSLGSEAGRPTEKASDDIPMDQALQR